MHISKVPTGARFRIDAGGCYAKCGNDVNCPGVIFKIERRKGLTNDKKQPMERFMVCETCGHAVRLTEINVKYVQLLPAL